MFDSVWIFTGNRMQGELLGSFLERSTGKPYRVFSDLGDVEAGRRRRVRALVLWDYEFRLTDGLSLMTAGKSNGSSAKADVITAFYNVDADFDQQQQLVLCGVQGIFYRSDPIGVLENGVRAIEKGEMWVSRRHLEQCVKTGLRMSNAQLQSDFNLTRRELEVLEKLAVGASNEEIAEALCISAYTVKTHNYRIFRKINVSNRMQASLWAINALNHMSNGPVSHPNTSIRKAPDGATARAG